MPGRASVWGAMVRTASPAEAMKSGWAQVGIRSRAGRGSSPVILVPGPGQAMLVEMDRFQAAGCGAHVEVAPGDRVAQLCVFVCRRGGYIGAETTPVLSFRSMIRHYYGFFNLVRGTGRFVGN